MKLLSWFDMRPIWLGSVQQNELVVCLQLREQLKGIVFFVADVNGALSSSILRLFFHKCADCRFGSFWIVNCECTFFKLANLCGISSQSLFHKMLSTRFVHNPVLRFVHNYSLASLPVSVPLDSAIQSLFGVYLEFLHAKTLNKLQINSD